MPSPLSLSPLAGRLFARRAVGLDAPHRDVATALSYHGYIQIDPLNICGRMHDLILRNRVDAYGEGDLMRYLHGGVTPEQRRTEDEAVTPAASARRPHPPAARQAFEHHVPGTGILVAFPLDAWPHLRGAMRTWSLGRGAWAGRLTPREAKLADELLAEIRRRGPLGSDDFDDDRRAQRVWGAAKLVKATLQKLFFHGRVLIAQRQNQRRRYDLPERVLPPNILSQPAADPDDTARWLVLLKLRQRRLVTLTRAELSLVSALVQPVNIEGCPPLYTLAADRPLLEEALAAADAMVSARTTPSAVVDRRTVHLLAPLDPLIYDRRVTATLWNFNYTWEAYTPAAKRVRGHYALPVLAGTELVGHVEPKADRVERRLVVASRRVRRGHALAPALADLARWLALRSR